MRSAVPSAASRVFISYRREDAAGHVLALMPALRTHFGAERIFKDTDNIPAGVDFLKFIKHELASCSVFLAVIGRDWLTIQDPRLKRRRLDNPDDFLRVEVATALKNERIRVIPVLVDRGAMPAAEDLPSDLADLAYRNAVELSDARWESDVQRLIHAIDEATTGAPDWFSPARLIQALTETLRGASRRLSVAPRLRRLAAAGTIIVCTSASLVYYAQTLPQGWWSGTPQPTSASVPTLPVSTPLDAKLERPADNPNPTPPPSAEAGRKEELEQYRKTALDLLRRGQRPQALDAVVAGLTLDPNDAELQKTRDSMLTAAERSAGAAKTRARNAGAESRAPELFNQARGLEEEALRGRQDNPAAAIRTYWRVAERFDHATKRATDVAKVTPPPTPAPVPSPSVPQGNDKAQIKDLIARYERAYDDMNVAAIKALYPAAPDYLQKEFDKYKEYGLTIICPDDVKLSADGATATAKCTFYHVMQPKDVATKIPRTETRQEFVFQKRDGNWTIGTLRR